MYIKFNSTKKEVVSKIIWGGVILDIMSSFSTMIVSEGHTTIGNYIVLFSFYMPYCFLFLICMFYPSTELVNFVTEKSKYLKEYELTKMINGAYWKAIGVSIIVLLITLFVKSPNTHTICSLLILWGFIVFFVSPLYQLSFVVVKWLPQNIYKTAIFVFYEVMLVVALFIFISSASLFVENSSAKIILIFLGIVGGIFHKKIASMISRVIVENYHNTSKNV